MELGSGPIAGSVGRSNKAAAWCLVTFTWWHCCIIAQRFGWLDRWCVSKLINALIDQQQNSVNIILHGTNLHLINTSISNSFYLDILCIWPSYMVWRIIATQFAFWQSQHFRKEIELRKPVSAGQLYWRHYWIYIWVINNWAISAFEIEYTILTLKT